MMQTGAGMVPPPMSQQQPQYNQPPPQPQQYQQPQLQQYQQPQLQQYQQPPQQQPWMTMPPPHQQPFQPPVWGQQPPLQAAVPPPMQAQPQQYPGGQATGSNEIKSLWIGDLQFWMDESYLMGCFSHTGQVVSVKVIRNRHTSQPEGYGFIEFTTRAAAEQILQTYNGTLMPNTEQQCFRMNWATLGTGEKRMDNTEDYSLFVGDLGPEVSDYMLQETFKAHYPSVKGAKVVIDKITGRTKGYGFVKFGDEAEQMRALTEMNGVPCPTRPMRVGFAANKKAAGVQQSQKATQSSAEANPGESDPSNTTIFVGGLDESVTDDHLRQVFGQYGDLVHVKIPVGKRCGFVQFSDRACAEQALAMLNGTQLGGHAIRLSWGRSPTNKQAQVDQTQSNGSYYGNGQGYNAYGYAQPTQNPSMYYGAYSGYGNYQQPQH